MGGQRGGWGSMRRRMNRTRKAVYLVCRHGYTTSWAAKATGLHYNTVMYAVRAAEVRAGRRQPEPSFRIQHDYEWARRMLVMKTSRVLRTAVREFAEGMRDIVLRRLSEGL